MKRKFVLLALFFCFYSCMGFRGYSDQLIGTVYDNIQIDSLSTIVIIPGAGCPGCITKAEFYCEEHQNDRGSLFIFTNIVSEKILRLKSKDIDFSSPSIIVDTSNTFFFPEYYDSEYPVIIKVEDGKIKKVERL